MRSYFLSNLITSSMLTNESSSAFKMYLAWQCLDAHSTPKAIFLDKFRYESMKFPNTKSLWWFASTSSSSSKSLFCVCPMRKTVFHKLTRERQGKIRQSQEQISETIFIFSCSFCYHIFLVHAEWPFSSIAIIQSLYVQGLKWFHVTMSEWKKTDLTKRIWYSVDLAGLVVQL